VIRTRMKHGIAKSSFRRLCGSILFMSEEIRTRVRYNPPREHIAEGTC
jgi:hypothetical protein